MKAEVGGKEENLASKCDRVRKELTNAKMDQKGMEEWINQAALRIVDFMPEVPLYVVASMSEAEREEMIKDKLPARVPFSMTTYQKAVSEGRGAEAEASLQSIARDTIDTSLELVEEGSLPDIRTNRMQKTRFLERTLAVHAAVTGKALGKEFFKKELNKKAEGGCAICRSKDEMFFWDMDANESTCKPDENTTADVIKFCSESCKFDFRCMPICPECGRDSDHVKKPGEGWPNPHIMRKLGVHTQAILQIQMKMATGRLAIQKASETEKISLLSDQEKLGGELAMQKAAFKDAEKNSELPNLWCRRCDAQCHLRDPAVFAPNMDICVARA